MFYEQHVKKGNFKMNSSGKVSNFEGWLSMCGGRLQACMHACACACACHAACMYMSCCMAVVTFTLVVMLS